MTTLKDTTADEKAEAELSTTVRLAVRAFDGRQLSDDELQLLCDAALSEPMGSRGQAAKP